MQGALNLEGQEENCCGSLDCWGTANVLPAQQPPAPPVHQRRVKKNPRL